LKLKHPRIARVLDRFVEDGRDYLVLEFIPGPTLRQLVKSKGKQKEKDALKWCKQLSEILEYLHGQEPPVLHRDLTPDNVILGNNGEIYLVDFGAANEYVGQATGTMIGKQCYIAPEQLRGKANKASDYYALGGTLYFLLTGEDPEPLSASSPKEKVPEISESTNALVKSLTAFEWQERATKYAQ
jgi:Serine/threonine protein kinase